MPPAPPPPRWVHVPSTQPAKLRLFVFPHSGSGAYPFRQLNTGLPPWVELSILQLPGRETMFGTPMYESMKSLIAATLPIIEPLTSAPYAFFGHSLGAHVAFELARALRTKGANTARGLVVSGTRAPQTPFRRQPLHALPHARFIEELRRYGGTPEAVLQNQELLEIFLPPLRADLTVFETQSYIPDAPLPFPITAFGGRTDHRTDPDELEAWKELTAQSFHVQFFEGGHFYLLEQSRPLFLAALRQTVENLI